MSHIGRLITQSKSDLQSLITSVATAVEPITEKSDQLIVVVLQQADPFFESLYHAAITELGATAQVLYGIAAIAQLDQSVVSAVIFHQIDHEVVESLHLDIPYLCGRNAVADPVHAVNILATAATYHDRGLDAIRSIAWVGVENARSQTLMLAAVKLGIEVILITGDVDEASIDHQVIEYANSTGLVRKSHYLADCLAADVVCVDSWANDAWLVFGEVLDSYEHEYQARVERLVAYQLTMGLVSQLPASVPVVFRLPFFDGAFVQPEVLESSHSAIELQSKLLKPTIRALIQHVVKQ